jgi:hypothetical protein
MGAIHLWLDLLSVHVMYCSQVKHMPLCPPLQEDTFQQYVRPEVNDQLSEFCIGLTGITQVSILFSFLLIVVILNLKILNQWFPL